MIVALALLLSLPAAAWSEATPRITTHTLEGSPFTLPDDLQAATDILVVGFTQKAGSATRPWIERLERDFTAADGFAVYAAAVIAGVPRLFRSFALNGIRASVSPADAAGS